MTTREQRAIASAELTIGRLLGVGGGSWAITRAAANGVSATSPASAGTWAGYVVEEAQPQQAATAPGPAAVAQRWAGVAEEGATALRAGDQLTSAENAAIRFTVVGPVTVAGYAKYALELLP